MRTARLMALLVVLAAFGMLLTGCGGETFLISKSQEIEIGQDAAADYERQHPVEENTQRARWLASIGDRIAAAAQPPNYPYEFKLVAEDVNNAFAYPGGPIFVYQGLIDELGGDEDMVAWICGHEATHVSHQHAIKRIERAVGAQLLIEWALGGGSKDIAGIVTGLAIQNYSRENEYEADKVGLRYAADAGYDPTAAIPVLETFRELQGRDPSDVEILFHSHPGSTDRVDAVKRHLRKSNMSGQYYSP
ncbi:MAG: M48 family metalloprotease [Armatimonadia bacterium]|nr:M48 family metalloprotease [Armatimonadia bacterium]